MVANIFRAIPLMEVTPSSHSPRGQWVPVGRREDVTGKNNYEFFDAVLIARPPEVASSHPYGDIPTRLGTIVLERQLKVFKSNPV